LRGEKRSLQLESLPEREAERLVSDLSEVLVEPASMEMILGLAGGRPLMLNVMGAMARSLTPADLRRVSGEPYRLWTGYI
jgi:hypothetical protein